MNVRALAGICIKAGYNAYSIGLDQLGLSKDDMKILRNEMMKQEMKE